MTKRQNEPENSWWEKAISRREAQKRIVVGGVVGAAVVSGVAGVGCRSEFNEAEAAETQQDALKLQQSEGWNVGSESEGLKWRNASATDSRGSLDWQQYTEPSALRKAWSPASSEWEPFVSNTLTMALSQVGLKNSVQPVHSASMQEAYSRGLGMKDLLQKSEDAASKAIVVDLPGPEAVAYAAALADYADVVLTFDNWPHPESAVPTHETLGALVYYADEVAEAKEKRAKDAPVVFVLDSTRLTEPSNGNDAFDNRYAVTMPTAENLKERDVEGILYAVPDQAITAELDDLNEDFVAYRDSGLQVTMMPLTDFRPADPAAVAEHGEIEDENRSGRSTYYYGGHPYFSPFFFAYYPMFMAGGGYRNYGSRTAPRGVGRPNYSPRPRSTMFSSRTTGGASGVGRQKPTGFGRVSTRSVNGRTVVSGTSSGRAFRSSRSSSRSRRSGSVGRSGGRGFSG